MEGKKVPVHSTSVSLTSQQGPRESHGVHALHSTAVISPGFIFGISVPEAGVSDHLSHISCAHQGLNGVKYQHLHYFIFPFKDLFTYKLGVTRIGVVTKQVKLLPVASAAPMSTI